MTLTHVFLSLLVEMCPALSSESLPDSNSSIKLILLLYFLLHTNCVQRKESETRAELENRRFKEPNTENYIKFKH